MKIAVVGGGSTYTPELADGLARLRGRLAVDELALMDTDLDRLEVVAGLCRRILANHGCTTVVTTTTSLPTAASGSAAVLLQIRVGGQSARHQDESWPLSCGCIGQETTGAGGLAKALRTVPVINDIAARIKAVNPDAWIINFTNPVGIVTRSLLDEGHRVIGLCNVAIGVQRAVAGLLSVDPDRIDLTHVGLNHLSWELDVQLSEPDGSSASVWADLLAQHGAALAAEVELPLSLLQRLDLLPSYYLRYFYEHDQLVLTAAGQPTRAQQVTKLERRLLAMYADPALTTKPTLLAERGGAYYSEAAVGLLAALLGTDPSELLVPLSSRHVVNIRNAGTLSFLPDDAVIETSAHVTSAGATAIAPPPVPPLLVGLIAHVSAYEQLALDAARHGGSERVFQALLAHPLIGQTDTAEALTELLLTHNEDWLPWATA